MLVNLLKIGRMSANKKLKINSGRMNKKLLSLHQRNHNIIDKKFQY